MKVILKQDQIILELLKELKEKRDDKFVCTKGLWVAFEKNSAFALEEVFNFIMSTKNNMPRLALRYAIEKMPAELKKHAVA